MRELGETVINDGTGGNSYMKNSKSDQIRALTQSLPKDHVTQGISQRSLGTWMTYPSAPHHFCDLPSPLQPLPHCPPAILLLCAVPQAILPARNTPLPDITAVHASSPSAAQMLTSQ